MQLLGDRVAVVLDELDDTTPSGLVMVTPTQGPREGTVVMVGEGHYIDVTGSYRPMGLAEGDRVLCPFSGGAPVTLDGQDLIIFDITAIIAII